MALNQNGDSSSETHRFYDSGDECVTHTPNEVRRLKEKYESIPKLEEHFLLHKVIQTQMKEIELAKN